MCVPSALSNQHNVRTLKGPIIGLGPVIGLLLTCQASLGGTRDCSASALLRACSVVVVTVALFLQPCNSGPAILATVSCTVFPLQVAPAMNTFMWESPFTAQHLDRIQQLGVTVVDPIAKKLACGDIGQGAMAAPEAIAKAVEAALVASGFQQHESQQ
eukprot:GHUV01046983.1.p2 GENE.GHUV01046983.1~~GHUV01046983.1.p2  ORF type:complete len:158 (+),score=24.41 GHUV01046983.1:107-580(+)